MVKQHNTLRGKTGQEFLRTGYLTENGLCTTNIALGSDSFYFP